VGAAIDVTAVKNAQSVVLAGWTGRSYRAYVSRKYSHGAQEFSALCLSLKKNFILYLRREFEQTSRVPAYLNIGHCLHSGSGGSGGSGGPFPQFQKILPSILCSSLLAE